MKKKWSLLIKSLLSTLIFATYALSSDTPTPPQANQCEIAFLAPTELKKAPTLVLMDSSKKKIEVDLALPLELELGRLSEVRIRKVAFSDAGDLVCEGFAAGADANSNFFAIVRSKIIADSLNSKTPRAIYAEHIDYFGSDDKDAATYDDGRFFFSGDYIYLPTYTADHKLAGLIQYNIIDNGNVVNEFKMYFPRKLGDSEQENITIVAIKDRESMTPIETPLIHIVSKNSNATLQRTIPIHLKDWTISSDNANATPEWARNGIEDYLRLRQRVTASVVGGIAKVIELKKNDSGLFKSQD